MPLKAAPRATEPSKGSSLRDATAQILALAAPADRESADDENAPPEDGTPGEATAPEEASPPAESSPEPEAPEAPEPDRALVPVYRVKVDGKEIEVPEDELIRGYSRDADYRRKTMQVAEERKRLAAEEARLQAERAEAARQREEYARAVQQFAELQKASEPPPIDWDGLRAADPARFAVEWASYQQRKEQREALAEEQRRLAAIRQQEEAAQYRALVKQEEAALLAAQPKWKDDAVRKADLLKIKDYARSKGYTQQQIDAITDHRIVLMLNEARLHAEAQARLADRRQRERPDTPEYSRAFAPPRPVPAGAPGSTARPAPSPQQAAQARLARTGKVKDAAAAIEGILKAQASNRR